MNVWGRKLFIHPFLAICFVKTRETAVGEEDFFEISGQQLVRKRVETTPQG